MTPEPEKPSEALEHESGKRRKPMDFASYLTRIDEISRRVSSPSALPEKGLPDQPTVLVLSIEEAAAWAVAAPLQSETAEDEPHSPADTLSTPQEESATAPVESMGSPTPAPLEPGSQSDASIAPCQEPLETRDPVLHETVKRIWAAPQRETSFVTREKSSSAKSIPVAPSKELLERVNAFSCQSVPRVLPPYLAKVQEANKPSVTKRRRILACVAAFMLCLFIGIYLRRENATGRQASSSVERSDNGTAALRGNFNAGSEEAAGNATFALASRAALENRLRPVNFLESLGGGQKIEIRKVDDVRPPIDGKRMIVYAILVARLDTKTERRWRDSGLFKDEVNSPNPFLRTITISTPGDLEELLNWHVEGILLKRPEIQSAQ